MDEYIKRAEVKSALEIINPVDFGGMMDYEAHHGASEALRFAGYAIDDIPSADVAPVRYGQWTKVDASYWKWKPDGPHVVNRVKYRHDECGKVSLKKENYCPGCGAKMR